MQVVKTLHHKSRWMQFFCNVQIFVVAIKNLAKVLERLLLNSSKNLSRFAKNEKLFFYNDENQDNVVVMNNDPVSTSCVFSLRLYVVEDRRQIELD